MKNPFLYAFSYYGLKEIPGHESNAKLLKIIKSEINWADDDSTIAWCAIFMTYIFKAVGLNIPVKPYSARSWSNIQGQTIYQEGDNKDLISNAQPGDVVIFWRGSRNGWKGHVAFYINEYDYDRNKIRTIGGNQSDGVLIRPYSKSRILKIIRID